jgi:hypothetical protein
MDTLHELDALIAEMLGWHDIDLRPYGDETDEWALGYPPGETNPQFLTPFSASLDAARLVEDEIERRGLQESYTRALKDIVCAASPLLPDQSYMFAVWRFVRTTPEQRCRAALAVLMPPSE